MFSALLFITFFLSTFSAESQDCFILNQNGNYQIEGTTLTIIGKGKMCECTGKVITFEPSIQIETLIVQNTVTRIGSQCFSKMSTLSSITFNEGLKEIGKGAFYGISLVNLQLPVTITKIEEKAFEQCRQLETLEFTPNSEMIIGDYAFRKCIKLSSFTIPTNLKTFNGKIIEGCVGLQSIQVDSDNKYFYSVGNLIITKEGKELVYCLPFIEGNKLILPENIESIGSFVLSDVPYETIILPSTLKQLRKELSMEINIWNLSLFLLLLKLLKIMHFLSMQKSKKLLFHQIK